MLNQNVHHANARGPEILQRSRENAPAVAACILQISFWTSLMSAAHIASDDFKADMHFDSTGDSFGATAQGGARKPISRMRNGGDCFAHMRIRALKCCTGHSIETVAFEQA